MSKSDDAPLRRADIAAGKLVRRKRDANGVLLPNKQRVTRWDVQDGLQTPEDCAAFIEAALEEAGDDPAFIAKALGEVARSRGIAQLARDTGISREGLYKALSAEGNPSLGTVLRVMRSLGLRLVCRSRLPAGGGSI